MASSSLARSFRGMLFGGAASVGLVASQAYATALTFEGLQNGEPIDNYYDGGLGGLGSGPGPNYGVMFTSNSVAFISKNSGGTGNFVDSPPPGDTAALFTGSGDYMDVAAGFTTSLSFYYFGAQSGSVTVYSGLNGTGSPLLSLTLIPDTNFGATGNFFSGTAEFVELQRCRQRNLFRQHHIPCRGTGCSRAGAADVARRRGARDDLARLSPKAHRGLNCEGRLPYPRGGRGSG